MMVNCATLSQGLRDSAREKLRCSVADCLDEPWLSLSQTEDDGLFAPQSMKDE